MLNNIIQHEMALPAARAEERDKEGKISKNPFNGANSWDSIAFNEIIAAISVTKGLLFMHAIRGSQLA
jgi:hypothetical protein